MTCDLSQIQLIATDYDTTLMEWRDGPYVCPEAREAIVAAAQAGITLGIASGRPWHDLRDGLPRAGLRWGDPFPHFVAAREKFITWVGEDQPDGLDAWNRRRAEEVEQLAQECLRRGPELFAALRAAGLRHSQWFLWGDYGLEIRYATIQEAERAREILAQGFADFPLATTHRNQVSAHVALSTGTKGPTLAALAKLCGLRPEQVLAIGDSSNDMDMVDGRYGLIGAAVGNAEPALKEAAALVATAERSAGVAEIIRRVLAARGTDGE